MITADKRCSAPSCEGKNIYRMVGHCQNCGTKDILILLTEGHRAPTGFFGAKCPVCGCDWGDGVVADRLATPEEIPAA